MKQQVRLSIIIQPKNMNSIFLGLLLGFSLTTLVANRSFAQDSSVIQIETVQVEKAEIQRDQGMWFGLYTLYHFSKNWGFYGEYHLRRAQGFEQMSKLAVRLGLNYTWNESFNLTGGTEHRLNWTRTPHLDTEEEYVPENRIWEQFSTRTQFAHLQLGQQVRLEQRWKRSASKTDPENRFIQRFRYKLSFCGHLYGQEGPSGIFACIYNELFMQAGNVEWRYYEENRTYAGLGVGITEHLSLQLGYMKSIGPIGDSIFKNEDIIRLNLFHKLNFFEPNPDE